MGGRDGHAARVAPFQPPGDLAIVPGAGPAVAIWRRPRNGHVVRTHRPRPSGLLPPLPLLSRACACASSKIPAALDGRAWARARSEARNGAAGRGSPLGHGGTLNHAPARDRASTLSWVGLGSRNVLLPPAAGGYGADTRNSALLGSPKFPPPTANAPLSPPTRCG